MDILITGGAGFIGSNLAEALAKELHQITVLDNFHTRSMENLNGSQKEIRVLRDYVTIASP
jgi:nucleoside-diphosphate-sugar epimerase